MSLMEDEDSDTEWQHPDWSQEIDVVEEAGLAYADFDVIKHWVVKLILGKDKKRGSGYFLNFPDVEDRHIILTAAHNLSTPDGTRISPVTIIYNNPEVTTYTLKPEEIYVGKNYKVAKNPDIDYGVVCIPKSSSEDNRGFGFSMKLGYAKYFKGNVYVSGFQDITPDGAPATSTGSCGTCHERHMEYHVETQGGLSGSAVWIEYGKTPMAVAIHNNGAQDSESGSRGARLTPELLREIYAWLDPKVLQTGVQLRATDIRKGPTEPILPSRGLFLSFKLGFGFGRVRFGSGSQFDLMPAQVILGEVSYAMATTADGKWVFFDPIGLNEVRLIEKVRDECLFKKVKKKPTNNYFRLVLQDKFQLRMEGNSILESDEDAESSEVSFVHWGAGDSAFFTRFLFE